MPTTTIPLVSVYNARPGIVWTSTPKDQRIVGGIVEVATDPIKSESIPYLYKRFGLSTNSTIVSSKQCSAFGVSDDGRFCFTFSDGTVYFKNTNTATAVAVGTGVTGAYISAAYFNDDTWFLISPDGTSGAFFLNATAANDSTPTFTANTNSNTTLSNVSSFTNLYVGQALSGTDIPAGARISSMNTGASTITMTAAATGTTVGVTVTFEQIAKIIDADFPTSPRGQFVFLDGYAFIMSSDGKIYNSALNDLTSWNASHYIQGSRVSSLAGTGQGIALIGNKIVGFYSGSHEYYYNQGNPAGSPLTRVIGSLSNIGIYNFAQTGDYLFAVGAPSGQQVVNCYLLGPDGMKEISSPPISRILSQSMDTADTAYLEAARADGMDFFFFEYTSFSVSWMYCVQTDRWFETSFSTNYLFSGGPTAGGLYAVATDGSILYKASSTVYQDGGAAFTMFVQTEPKALNGGKGFTINEVRLLADNQSSGSTTLETSADDYGTWVTRGTFSLTENQKQIVRCGFYKNACAFRLTDSGNNAWRGQALIVDWEPAVT